MQAKSQILMRILLNRFHPKAIKEFLDCLPKEEARLIQSQDTIISDIDPVFVKPEEFLKNIHFSWAVPHIQKLSPAAQGILISALPIPLASGLKKYLKIQSSTKALTPPAKAFLMRKLYDKIQDPEILTPSLLPSENLSVLLNMSSKELVKIIDFLGLYDLAEAVKNIVDKAALKTVYQCLDQKKMQFMRLGMYHTSKIVTRKLDLKKWQGDCDELLRILHQRGLYRLGKALNGSNPHFLWHLSHRFDVGRSAILKRYYSAPSSPGITSALVQQVMNVLNFLKEKSET